ncbi:MAG: ImmA/IrrE family metallo-endopeptidase [Nocardioidaceae bacterium]
MRREAWPGSREDVERRAEQVLAAVPTYVWDGETLPVPVQDVADSCFGLLVRDVADLSQAPGAPQLGGARALSGLLIPAAGEIWIDASEAGEWPTRRRFTIGHELGHWCLHRSVGDGTTYCRSATVVEDAPATGLPAAEHEANLFAAALLMPARLVRRQNERGRDFAELCATFEVSGAALERRLAAVIGA